MGFSITSLFGKKPSAIQKMAEEKQKAQKEIDSLNKELIKVNEQREFVKTLSEGKNLDDIIKAKQDELNRTQKEYDKIKKQLDKPLTIGKPQMEKADGKDVKKEGFISQIPATNPLLLDA